MPGKPGSTGTKRPYTAQSRRSPGADMVSPMKRLAQMLAGGLSGGGVPHDTLRPGFNNPAIPSRPDAPFNPGPDDGGWRNVPDNWPELPPGPQHLGGGSGPIPPPERLKQRPPLGPSWDFGWDGYAPGTGDYAQRDWEFMDPARPSDPEFLPRSVPHATSPQRAGYPFAALVKFLSERLSGRDSPGYM